MPEYTTTRPHPLLKPAVGRETESQTFQNKLAQDHFVVLAGRTGIGKSRILANLITATRVEIENIVWLDCARILGGLDDVLWEIGQAINNEGFLEFLEDDRYLNYPDAVKVGRLFYQLLQLETERVICLDNLHAWFEHPSLIALVSDFKDYVQRGYAQRLKLVLLTQEMPQFLHESVFEFLPGSTPKGLEQILADHALSVPNELSDQIWRTTWGHPRQSIIIATAIQQATESLNKAIPSDAQFAAFALQNQALENELAWHNYETLSFEDQLVLQAIAVFTQPVSPDMLKWALLGEAIQGVQAHRRSLINKFLLQKANRFSYDVTISPLDRAFYLSEADFDLLSRLNQRVGRYYELQEDAALAAYHYDEARRYSAS